MRPTDPNHPFLRKNKALRKTGGRKPVPEKTKEEMIDLRKAGHSYPEISRSVHLALSTVERYLKGVIKPKRGGPQSLDEVVIPSGALAIIRPMAEDHYSVTEIHLATGLNTRIIRAALHILTA